jgi:hypothetical protein
MSVSLFTGSFFIFMKTSSWGSASAVCNTARAEDGE